jgi:hypothetical protein
MDASQKEIPTIFLGEYPKNRAAQTAFKEM